MLGKEVSTAVGIRNVSGRRPTLVFAEQKRIDGVDGFSAWLTSLPRQYDLTKCPCTLVLSSQGYQLFQTDLTGLSGADRRDAARWQIRENLDYPSEEAVVDVFDVIPFGGDRKTLSYVVASPQSYLKPLVRQIKETDLALSAIDIPEFSLRNLCCCSNEDERGTALLWLAESEGMLAIVREGQLYLARSFSIGMNDLRPYADGDYEALTEQLDAIVLEIQRSFDFCESTFLLPMVSRLLVAQCGDAIPAVCHYVNEYLATKVEAFDLNEFVDVSADLAESDLNLLLLSIGAAMRQEPS